MPKIAIIYTTCRDKSEAKKIARVLMREKLIACVNILGEAYSIYFWNGKIREEKEVTVLFKTKKILETKAMKRIKEIHSYKCPCIISLHVAAVDAKYLRWVDLSLRKS